MVLLWAQRQARNRRDASRHANALAVGGEGILLAHHAPAEVNVPEGHAAGLA